MTTEKSPPLSWHTANFRFFFLGHSIGRCIAFAYIKTLDKVAVIVRLDRDRVRKGQAFCLIEGEFQRGPRFCTEHEARTYADWHFEGNAEPNPRWRLTGGGIWHLASHDGSAMILRRRTGRSCEVRVNGEVTRDFPCRGEPMAAMVFAEEQLARHAAIAKRERSQQPDPKEGIGTNTV